MIIRKAELKDAAGIEKIKRDTIRLVNSKDYSADKIRAWMDADSIDKVKEKIVDKTKVTFVAVDRGVILGIASFSLKDGELGFLYVKHDIHKKGVGTKLMQYAERCAKEKGLKKLKLGSTITAVDFYSNLGYKTINKNHCIVVQGMKLPCILMSKRL